VKNQLFFEKNLNKNYKKLKITQTFRGMTDQSEDLVSRFGEIAAGGLLFHSVL